MEQVTLATFAVPFVIGVAVMWGIDRWYYTRNGRAKVKELEAQARKDMEERLEELRRS